MLGLLTILGAIFAIILIALFGIFAGGATIIACAHIVIPIIVTFVLAKIIYSFLKQLF